ncbi:MAG TPA: class I SAM-dependent methyltransferase [Candidatus Sulfotelmatobacter sp.]|jgi:2-polyprenyl-3-methyl-5-hydroxy-6-metoxy-1,4-benzoquinol methylase|nr:class I SAM-dependent methyltransferase [Candidatus Sulfotelmatobacter sp.]
MDTKTHWEKVYKAKAPEAVSWYRPHLETSIALIKRAGAEPGSSIIDVGAGESTLADDLLSLGYENITALDISQIAVDVCKKRLGAIASRVRWLVADVTAPDLRLGAYDVWHDRAVFHFLTTVEQRIAYVRNVARSVRRGGHVIVSTFGPEGPSRCSGLDVVRYNAESLHHEFGKSFRLVESAEELHQTPFGTTQQFLYCYCQIG